MEEKIIQIISAPKNLYIEYKNEDNPDRPFINPVICLALTDQGDIYVMDIDDTGFVDKAEDISNYYGVRWEGE